MFEEGGETVPRTIWLIFVFILAVLAVVVFVMYVGSFGQTQCWRDSLNEIRTITGTFEVKSLGVGNLLGLPEFNTGLSMKSSCLDRVIFGGGKKVLEECKAVCQGTERFDGHEDCLEECAWCLESKGCIILVPKTGELSDIFKSEEGSSGFINYLKARSENIKVFNSPDFGFSDETFVSPEEGVVVKCLKFTKAGEEADDGFYSIDIVKGNAKSIKECKVTELEFL